MLENNRVWVVFMSRRGDTRYSDLVGVYPSFEKATEAADSLGPDVLYQIKQATVGAITKEFE